MSSVMKAVFDSSVAPRAILLADPSLSTAHTLSGQFRKLGFDPIWTAKTAEEARDVVVLGKPEVVVAELRLDDSTGFDLVRELTAMADAPRVAIVTAYCSVPATVRLIRLGASACLSKPATAAEILQALDLRVPRADRKHHFTLNGAMWEFLSTVLINAETLSEAARRLRVDRSSLRRMLSRRAPADNAPSAT